MKFFMTFLSTLLILSLLVLPAQAYSAKKKKKVVHKHFHKHINETTVNNYNVDSTEKNAGDNKLGFKGDAPNLIKITENSSVGVEGGKDFLDTNKSEGWFGFLKYTWNGTFFDFSK